jgi:hypothetical protein
MTDNVNYPDILGAITGGARCNIGVAQAALALRPRVARIGRPFEIILLLQNACDVEADVTTTLHLPDVDARKQRGRFVAKSMRLVIGMAPAEVGYVMLPATTLPDTEVSDSYKIGVEVDAKPLQKPRRVRLPEGGGAYSSEYLKPDAREKVEALQSLSFSTTKRMGRNILEAPLSLMSGTLGQIVDLKPGWVSICKLVDYADSRPMLHRYGDLLRVSILPRMKRHETYPALLETTKQRFREAGFQLYEAEAALIAKLLTLIVEYAAPNETAHGYAASGKYSVTPLLVRDPLAIETPPVLPHWIQGMLQLVDRDARVADHPVLTLTQLLYEELVFDAAVHAFDLVERETGEDLGSPAEIEGYARSLANMLREKQGLAFSRVYLPLIMGGILVNDRMPVSKESPLDLLRSLALAMDERALKLDEDETTLIEMTERMIERTGQKYGLRPG